MLCVSKHTHHRVWDFLVGQIVTIFFCFPYNNLKMNRIIRVLELICDKFLYMTWWVDNGQPENIRTILDFYKDNGRSFRCFYSLHFYCNEYLHIITTKYSLIIQDVYLPYYLGRDFNQMCIYYIPGVKILKCAIQF